jgi:small GTP-binding protein
MGNLDTKEQRASLIDSSEDRNDTGRSIPRTAEESIMDELSRLNWADEFGKFTSMVSQDWTKFVDTLTQTSSTPRTQAVTLPLKDSGIPNDVFFKVVLLGDEQTGKTALLYRYAKNIYPEEPSQTIVFDMDDRKLRTFDGKVVKLLLLSHAGSEIFLEKISSSLNEAVGFVLVYDTTNIDSLKHVTTIWSSQIKKHATNENCPIFLLGTKTDLRAGHPSPVDPAEIRKVAASLRCESLEVSAKESSDAEVNYIFERIVEVTFDSHLQETLTKSNKTKNGKVRTH